MSDFDVMVESRLAERFCIEHGTSERESKLIAIFVEETAIAHGKDKGLTKLSVDYRIATNGRKVSITLRDCCEYFDPLAFYEVHKDTSPEHMLGIKIIMRLADDVRYFNAFNSNNIMICMYTNQDSDGNNT